MDARDFIKYLRGITLKEAYGFARRLTGNDEFDSLFKRGGIPWSNRLSDWFNFLDKPDPLTDALYGKPSKKDGTVLFPFSVKNPEFKEHRGRIGDQTSKWHLETLPEHVAMVAVGLTEKGLSEAEACTLAILHDIGKKYTFGTNRRGEVSFYGHEKVGAVIAAIHGRCLPWVRTSWEHREIVALIYGHTLTYSLWPIHPEKKEEYFKQLVELYGGEESFASQTMQQIELFTTVDVGCKTKEELEEARKPGGIIEKGRAMIAKI